MITKKKPRYYLPLTAVDASVLRPSATRTQCPYKGEAEYYSVEVDGTLYEDIVWYYNRPILESALITGLVAFYNEKASPTPGPLPSPPLVFFHNSGPHRWPRARG